MRARRTLPFLLQAMMIALPGWGGCVHAAEPIAEQSLRVALVFNFLQFSEWPGHAASRERLRVCVASGDREQQRVFQSIDGQRVRGTPVETVVYQPGTACDLIYLDSRQRWKSIQGDSASAQALTVGEYPGFVEEGGIIELALSAAAPRFQVNLAPARQAGLRLNPKMLRLARRVIE